MSIKCPSRDTGVIQDATRAPPVLPAKSNPVAAAAHPCPPPAPAQTADPSRTRRRLPRPRGDSAGRQEIIHMVSHRGVGVQCQPERSAACLLSPAIEVIHGTIIPRRIVQEKIAKAAAPRPPPSCPPLSSPPSLSSPLLTPTSSCLSTWSQSNRTACLLTLLSSKS